MTSRETTGLLPRSEGSLIADAPGRSAADWAALLGYGAITWPWLLKSLYGGTKAARRRLLERLDLPQDALPNLGSWKADTGLLTLIIDHIEAKKPKLVVEFGTGASTLIIAKALEQAGGGTLISFDQHPEFVAATREWLGDHGLEADLRSVPLRPSSSGWPGLWYDHGALPDAIDLLLIDGPPWTLHPLTRGAADIVFDQVTPGGTILLDDAARPGERVVARRWRKARPDFEFRLWKGGTKGTLIGVRRA